MAVPGKKITQQFTTSSKESDNELIVYCLPCDKDQTRFVAHGYCKNCCEHLCESCFNKHKNDNLFRDHILLDNISMPQTIQPPPERLPQPYYEVIKPCPKHKKEVIKFFCDDHQTLKCQVCILFEKYSSCNVKYIPDISGDAIDGKEYQELLKKLDSISDRFHEMKDNVNKAFLDSDASLKDISTYITIFRKDINQRIDELEKQIEHKVKDIHNEHFEQMKKVDTVCDNAISILQTSFDKIKQFNTSKESDELFIEIKCVQQMITEYEKELSDEVVPDFKKYEFVPNQTFLTKDVSLGTLVSKSTKKVPKAKISESGSFSHAGVICVKTPKDKRRCRISGMTFFTPDTLIIADHDNNAVKMVDTRSRSVRNQLQLASNPYDITKVNGTELAVTLPYIWQIQFMSVNSNKLYTKIGVKVEGECHGINCHQDKLIVSLVDSSKIAILDMNGTVLKTFGNGHSSGPLYVVCNSSSIYVSDWKTKVVTHFDWQGKVINSYNKVDDPKALVLLEDGTVLVSDRTRDVIVDISRDDSTGEAVIKGLKRPHALCWCADTNVLYYSSRTIQFEDDNILQCYKLS